MEHFHARNMKIKRKKNVLNSTSIYLAGIFLRGGVFRSDVSIGEKGLKNFGGGSPVKRTVEKKEKGGYETNRCCVVDWAELRSGLRNKFCLF
jgi:hypothetical protein